MTVVLRAHPMHNRPGVAAAAQRLSRCAGRALAMPAMAPARTAAFRR